MRSFQGKRVVITGASAGIGLALARAFHSHGASTVLVARRVERLTAIAEELNAIRPDSAEILVCDLTGGDSSAPLESLLAMVRETQVDVLVNNAGIGSFGPFETLDLKREK